MKWMLLPFRRYFDFSGRSRRKEFWMFILFTLVLSAILSRIDDGLGLTWSAGESSQAGNGILSALFSLATLIPGLAVNVRRLHDVNRAGWWLAAPLVWLILGGIVIYPVMGGGSYAVPAMIVPLLLLILALLIFYTREGTSGTNRFGPDPKDPAGARDLQDVFR